MNSDYGLVFVTMCAGALLGVGLATVVYDVMIIPQIETLHDGLTSQSSHCSSITAISDKIRCLENRIDIMNATITELDK